MEGLPIKTAARSCVALFTARLDEQTLFPAKDQFDEELDCLETQSARFNLWADNIGALAEGHASLDYRLHEYPDLENLVRDQLSAIQKHLKRLSDYTGGPNDHDQLLAAEASDDGGESDASVSTLSSTSGTSGSQAAREQEPSPLVAIIPAIHRLHRLAMAIRRSSAADQNLKATEKDFYDEDGIDLVEAFRKYTFEVLQFTRKGAPEGLLHRLSQANAARRRRFLYRQKHQKKLKGRRESAPKQKSTNTIRATSLISSNTMHKVTESSPFERKSRPASTVRSSAIFSNTTASGVNRENFKPVQSVQSTVHSASPSTQIQLDPSFFPPAPKVMTGVAEFYCPYCCMVQPAAERSGRRWRQHFLKDLEPFVCLVEHCSDPHQVFHDRTHWVSHMESHSLHYTCRLGGHKPETFTNEAEFDCHIRDKHAQFKETQLSHIKKYSSKSTPLDLTQCPLCGFSCNSGSAGFTELLNHIATELQYIALWSLVGSDDIENDISSDQSSLRIADESTQADSDNGSLTFNLLRMDEKDGWLENDVPPGADEFENVQQPPPGADLQDEWLFTNAQKPKYPDPEMDPKLETFVRRVHLEKILEEGKAVDPVLPCRSIPIKRNRDFYGRQGLLERLEKALHPLTAAKGMPSSITLSGPAGIGKTQVAAEFCWNLEKQFDAIFWVHADEESKLANDFAKIAIRLGFVAENTAEAWDHDHTRSVVKAWLSNPLKSFNNVENAERATWLLIFDHVIDPNTINDYWPSGCTSGSILITNRKPMPWGEAKYPTLWVEPFNTDDSAALLSILTRNENDKQQHRITLGQRAHHSPTQLRFLAKMITGGRYSMEKFMKASKEGEGQQAILKLHAEDAKLNNTDFAEWALESLEKGSGLLDVLSMLDPDDIPERILTSPPDNIAIPNFPMTLEAYYEARAELASYSFIERAKSTGNLSIQRVIQDATRRKMTKPYYRDVFNTCVKLINEAWPYQPFTWRHSISRWAKCDELLPHIARLKQFSRNVLTEADDMEGAYEYARLCTDCGWYCHERGKSQECEELCVIGQRVCEKLKSFLNEYRYRTLKKGVTRQQVDYVLAEIHHNQGCIAAEMNQPELTRMHQGIFNEMMIKEVGFKHPGSDMRLAISFNQIGVAHMINNDWDKGEECFRRSIYEMERLEEYEKFKISLPLVNWASVCWLTGRYKEAEEKLLEGLADRMAKFGKNDCESYITGRYFHGLGNVKLAERRYDESYDYHEKAREHYKVTLGRQHHRFADVTGILGSHHMRKGEDITALDFFDKALGVYGDRGLYSPEKTRALFKRSEVLRRLGRIEESEKDAEECARLYHQLVPHDERPLEQLSDPDFDSIIVFWSR